MKFPRVRSISILLATFVVTSCSVALPRAPRDREETVAFDLIFQSGLRTEARLAVTRKMMNLTFSKASNVSCIAIFPGKDIKSTFTCQDGMTGSVNMNWLNGGYSGTATFSDGEHVYFSRRQQSDYQGAASGYMQRQYPQT